MYSPLPKYLEPLSFFQNFTLMFQINNLTSSIQVNQSATKTMLPYSFLNGQFDAFIFNNYSLNRIKRIYSPPTKHLTHYYIYPQFYFNI